jgi:FMN reductase
MADNFNAYAFSDGFAPDFWNSTLRLIDDATTVPDDETAADRWERAELLFDSRDYLGAAKLLSAVVAEVPEHTGAQLLLARAHYHSAQLRRAEEGLRDIIERDPVNHYAYLMLGRTLQRQGRHDEAEQWLRMASAFSGEPVGTEESR